MPNILIADRDELFLKELEDYFAESSYEFGLFPAKNGKEAVRIVEESPVDLVVTELKMPEMDGFQLLAYLNDHFPFIPVIVVGEHGTPETRKKLDGLGILAFMDKPIHFKALEAAILSGLDAEQGKGSITGVSVVSFIQLVDSDQKTCLLEARTKNNRPGYLYFNRGELWDAMWGGLTGREAAIEIIGWEEAEIYFKSLPRKRIKRRIESGLMSLIMAAMKHKDEKLSADRKKAVADREPEDVEDGNQKAAAADEDSEMTFSFEPFDEDADDAILEEETKEPPPEEKIDHVETRGPLSLALEELQEIPGVEAVMVLEQDGSVLECSETASPIDMTKVGVSVAMVLEGTEKMRSQLGISQFQHLMFESGETVIVCAPIGSSFLVLVARDAQRLGMIRMRLKKKIPEMEIDFKIQ